MGSSGGSLILGEACMGRSHRGKRGEHQHSVSEGLATVGKAGSTQLRQTESEVKFTFQRDAGGRTELLRGSSKLAD